MFVSEATICRTFKHFGFSQKKIKYTALQRSDLIRAEYQAEIAIYDPSMLVFVMNQALTYAMLHSTLDML